MPSTLTGARLRERRLSLGLRQADLAARAMISASYLNLIEHNRRNVTPDVLERLALALGLDAESFSDRPSSQLTEDLRSAAAAASGVAAELDRIEEFLSRFPGWAELVADQQRRCATLERAVASLNDRLGHDPHLSAALHELLSALSGVRATAEILAETTDLSLEWQQRFHRNLHQDSERLAHGAEALVSYLDRKDETQSFGPVSAQDEVEAWRAGRGWHLPETEGEADGADQDKAAAAAFLDDMSAFSSDAARARAAQEIEVAHDDARRMPLEAFRSSLERLGPDPARLAAEFGVGIIAVLRRIASLPGAGQGLVICDASGTILLRKPMAGFTVPRFGAACPLWPVFLALGRPGQAIRTLVSTPEGEIFVTQAFCEVQHPFGFGGVELRVAAMLIQPASAEEIQGARALGQATAIVPLGSTCRICARGTCPARREPSILGPMAEAT